MPNPVVKIEGLSKQYRIGIRETQPPSPGGMLWSLARAPFRYLSQVMRPPTEQEILWALRDVSFDVQRGEIVGIIGRNGAGKSTLLKILSRITEPTRGRAVITGHVGSLLEVGTGFHPELTGRENIYMSGTILGMKKREIDRKLDEIIAFAEIERFIETPVKRYSSGMHVRLGFAVAAHLDPEILIVDEVLAVGDQAFQKKCLGKMSDVQHQGRTILFVSHNMAVVGSLCERIVWLKDGEVVADGKSDEVIRRYVIETSPQSQGERLIPDQRGLGYLLVRPEQEYSFLCGEPVKFSFEVISPHPAPSGVGLVLYDMFDNPVLGASSTRQGFVGEGGGTRWRIECDMGLVPLNAGEYRLSVYFGDNRRDYGYFQKCLTLNIVPADPYGWGKENPGAWGHFYWKPEWRIDSIREEDSLPQHEPLLLNMAQA